MTIRVGLILCAAPSSLESQFTREKKTLVCYDGPTSEESCSGTGLRVYLKGDQICHLDWTVEMSHQVINRRYYFEGTNPRLVVETLHTKVNDRGDLLDQPKLKSVESLRLDAIPRIPRQEESLDHAAFLVTDFKTHRREFLHSDG